MRFQDKVRIFTNDTFGSEIANNLTERCNRFAEESIELLQSAGYSKEKMLDMLDYVYHRESGKQAQEVGGVMVTLAALCNVIGVDMIKAAGREIIRAIRNSQFIKMKHNGKPAGLAMHEENMSYRFDMIDTERKVDIDEDMPGKYVTYNEINPVN